MGLLDNQTQNDYYTGTGSDFGTYQFVTLDNIINAFMYMYVGEDKIITKLSRTDAQFCGMRAIQEFSYDIFRSVKSQEIEVPNTLQMILPQDYVNYVKLARVDSNGIERVLYPTGKTSNPFAITQTPDGTYISTIGDYSFSSNMANMVEQSPSNSWANYQTQSNTDAYGDDTTDIEIDNYGRRYGLDPQYAQSNGTFSHRLP